MNQALPYRIPQEPGRARAIALAAGVHALLIAFLWIGVRWQNETPIAVEAEIWSPQAREAAPKAPLPPAEIESAVKPQILAPTKPTPPALEKTPPQEKPEIALEQLKKRKAEQRLEQAREEQKEQREQENIKKKAEEKRALTNKLTQEKIVRDQAIKDLAAKEQAEKSLLKKAASDKKRQLDELEKKQRDKAFSDEMGRMQANVTGSGGSGTAPRSQGGRADSGYIQKVGARIKSNTIFNVNNDLEGNPAVEYTVELLPDGSIRTIRKTKSSGVPGFDDAVRNAIEKSAPFPADKSGIAPASFTMTHRPKDS